MYNPSANGYSGGGGGGGPGYPDNPQYHEQGEPLEEDEFGRTEEGEYASDARVLSSLFVRMHRICGRYAT